MSPEAPERRWSRPEQVILFIAFIHFLLLLLLHSLKVMRGFCSQIQVSSGSQDRQVASLSQIHPGRKQLFALAIRLIACF